MNSGEVKQFLDSFLYIKGTIGALAAISVPADCLVHDELDFSDEETVSNYESRLTHSKYEMKRKFSTPTVNGRGITAEFDTSKRHWNFVKCCHCNERFVPDYFKHVRVPGYDGDLRAHQRGEPVAGALARGVPRVPGLRQGAGPVAGVPRVGGREHRVHDGDKNGYQVTPFDAPKIITPAKLVQKSTKYERYADFVNYNLGLPCEDLESSFSEEELRELFTAAPDTDPSLPYAYVMGIDVGITCHMVVAGAGAERPDGIVHMEKCPHTELERRKGELARSSGARLVHGLAALLRHAGAHAGARSQPLGRRLHADEGAGGDPRGRQGEGERDGAGEGAAPGVAVNRNRVLDLLMMFFRAGNISASCASTLQELKEAFIKHMKDMKRMKRVRRERRGDLPLEEEQRREGPLPLRAPLRLRREPLDRHGTQLDHPALRRHELQDPGAEERDDGAHGAAAVTRWRLLCGKCGFAMRVRRRGHFPEGNEGRLINRRAATTLRP
jgi:hypothetical protein